VPLTVAGALEFSAGTIRADDALTVTGVMTWSGGTLTGSGTTYIASGAALNVIGISAKHLDQHILDNAGTTTWTDSHAFLSNGATINNSGTWHVQDTVGLVYAAGAVSTLNNSGTLVKTAGSGITQMEVSFYNSGAVEVETGTLRLGRFGSGNSSGSFTVAPGATLDFWGTHVLDGSSSLTGGGEVDVSDGTTTISGTYNITGTTRVSGGTANLVGGTITVTTVSLSGGVLNLVSDVNVIGDLTQSAGFLDGSGTVTVTGVLTWSGGGMRGSGATVADGGMTINGADKTLDGRTLVNSGTATWTNGKIWLSNGTTIVNSRTQGHSRLLATAVPFARRGGVVGSM
jgi:hypothetical protein